MFGSGSLDLGHPPHAIDSEVVVFLFRPVDRVLGAMPIVGDLILGGRENLLAAYFRLEGPWEAPTATYQPLRTLNTGPLRLVTGLPSVVRRALQLDDAGRRRRRRRAFEALQLPPAEPAEGHQDRDEREVPRPPARLQGEPGHRRARPLVTPAR
jgi:hypothetical protein